MKRTETAYIIGRSISFAPAISKLVSDKDVAEVNPKFAEYLAACSAAEDEAHTWYKAHRAGCAKQTWKNKKNKIYKRHLAPFADGIRLELQAAREKIYKKQLELLETITVKITFDGRRVKNFWRFRQAAEMALNCGGSISPQYCHEGLKAVEII